MKLEETLTLYQVSRLEKKLDLATATFNRQRDYYFIAIKENEVYLYHRDLLERVYTRVLEETTIINIDMKIKLSDRIKILLTGRFNFMYKHKYNGIGKLK